MMTTQQGVRVFVYGTLKGMAHGIFMGHGRTIDQFTLHSGGYPVLKDKLLSNKYNGHVLGEVFDVSLSELEALDKYEGYPTLYTRKQIDIQYTKPVGQSKVVFKTKAWAYFGKGTNLDLHPIISPDHNNNLQWMG